MESSEITNFMVADDINTKLYNNDQSSIVKIDLDNEMFVGIRSSNIGGSHRIFNGNIQVVATDFTDVHEMVFGGDSQKIIDFAANLGLTLTDAEIQLIYNIDKNNLSIIPETGDYNRFVPLTEEQYNKLSPEEQQAYNEAKEAEEKRVKNYTGKNMAARITV